MNQSKNYKFKLPSESDIININDLNDNFRKIDAEMGEVSIPDALDVIYASGTMSFPYEELVPFGSLLSSVNTTWGSATFGNKYGEFTPTIGTDITLAIGVYVKDGIVYWDEYYNTIESGIVVIGTTTFYGHRGDAVCSFDYVNDDIKESEKMTVSQAIIELASRIKQLRG